MRLFHLKKKAQNAVEFLAMLSVLILIFSALFGFVISQYGSVSVQKDNAVLTNILDDIDSEIQQASFAPDGYARTFYVQGTGASVPYTVAIRNTAELYINDSNGNQQIVFLKPEEYLNGNVCARQNQIFKSEDYGIAICCNSCNGTIPGVNYSLPVECKTNVSSYWGNCNNLTRGNNLTQIRTNCSLWMSAANFTIYNQTGNQILALNSLSVQTQVRNASISWISLNLPTSVLVSNTTYNVSAVCYNATTAYTQFANFTIS